MERIVPKNNNHIAERVEAQLKNIYILQRITRNFAVNFFTNDRDMYSTVFERRWFAGSLQWFVSVVGLAVYMRNCSSFPYFAKSMF